MTYHKNKQENEFLKNAFKAVFSLERIIWLMNQVLSSEWTKQTSTATTSAHRCVGPDTSSGAHSAFWGRNKSVVAPETPLHSLKALSFSTPHAVWNHLLQLRRRDTSLLLSIPKPTSLLPTFDSSSDVFMDPLCLWICERALLFTRGFHRGWGKNFEVTVNRFWMDHYLLLRHDWHPNRGKNKEELERRVQWADAESAKQHLVDDKGII